MAEIPENMKFLLFGLGPRRLAQIALTMDFLGVGTAILGIISSAAKSPVGLGASDWFLLTIIFFIWGLSDWFTAYFGAKEGYKR